MAFEIYSATADMSSGKWANQVIDKMIEMWEFDSVDQESEWHSASFGNGTITAKSSNYIGLINDSGDVCSTAFTTTPMRFSVVKTDSSLLVSFESSSDGFATIIVGKTTNIDGTKGKGVMFVHYSSDGKTYMVTDNWQPTSTVFSESLRSSDGLTQLVPIAATLGGDFFDNAYRVTVGTDYKNRGLYTIGDDRWYISQRTAIKEE